MDFGKTTTERIPFFHPKEDIPKNRMQDDLKPPLPCALVFVIIISYTKIPRTRFTEVLARYKIENVDQNFLLDYKPGFTCCTRIICGYES